MSDTETKTEQRPAPRKPDPKKHPLPQQPVDVRIHNFSEVALGYDEETAVAEALRCLQLEARLTPDQAQQCLNDVYDERLAAEARQQA